MKWVENLVAWKVVKLELMWVASMARSMVVKWVELDSLSDVLLVASVDLWADYLADLWVVL